MAEVLSLESAELEAVLPADLEAPDVPALGATTILQDLSVPKGRSIITLSWAGPPFKGEPISGELLGLSTGGNQVLEAGYDPVIADSYEVWEMSAAKGGAGYGDSVTTAIQLPASKHIGVADLTDFNIGDWCQIKDGAHEEFFQVIGVAGYLNVGGAGLQFEYAVGATVKAVQSAVLKVETTDYSINLTTGQVALIFARFSIGSSVILKYQSGDVGDLSGYQVYRVEGNAPVANPTIENVQAHPGVVDLGTLAPAALGIIDELMDTENGKTLTYYIFAYDDESPANYSLAGTKMVETLTSRPIGVTTQPANNKVVLSWDAITDPNFGGVNVYRCEGEVFVPAEAKKVNLVPILGTEYVDGEETDNRAEWEFTPYPANGSTFTYALESVDVNTAWTSPTANASTVPLKSEVLVGVK